MAQAIANPILLPLLLAEALLRVGLVGAGLLFLFEIELSLVVIFHLHFELFFGFGNLFVSVGMVGPRLAQPLFVQIWCSTSFQIGFLGWCSEFSDLVVFGNLPIVLLPLLIVQKLRLDSYSVDFIFLGKLFYLTLPLKFRLGWIILHLSQISLRRRSDRVRLHVVLSFVR